MDKDAEQQNHLYGQYPELLSGMQAYYKPINNKGYSN